jgi:hypothetical protein
MLNQPEGAPMDVGVKKDGGSGVLDEITHQYANRFPHPVGLVSRFSLKKIQV